jgi:hypothetical protein
MPVYTVNDLIVAGKANNEMTKPATVKRGVRITGAPTTCYELAVFSLVMTGDLKGAVCEAWRSEVPKADTFKVIVPETDARITDPLTLPANSIVGFYRRFRAGERSQVASETAGGWVIYHMVRTTGVANSTNVVGGNNGDRESGQKKTTPGWSQNDVTVMFDWTGAEDTSMAPMNALPARDSYGADGKQQFVAFGAPIATVVSRLNRAFPGPAVFG